MPNITVPNGSLSGASAPEDLFLKLDDLIDLRTESEEDRKLIEFCSSQITPYSEFQSKSFVVNTEVTDHRKIQQVALEIRARIVGTGDSHYQTKKAEIEIRKLERSLAQEQDPLEKELLELEIEKRKFDVQNTKLIQYQSQLEIKKLLNILKEIAPNNTLEAIKNYKDNWEEKEEEYWTKRMGKQAMMDIMMSGKIQTGVLDSIIGMPLESQKKVVGYALLQTQKMEKGITQIGEAVRNVLLANEANEGTFELPSITGLTGEYGANVDSVTKSLEVGRDGVVKAIGNK